MITCNLQGGLGNQLFQIYTTISYAMETQNSFFFLESKNCKFLVLWITQIFLERESLVSS